MKNHQPPEPNSSQFQSKYVGPYIIKKEVYPNVYKLKDTNFTVNVIEIKRYHKELRESFNKSPSRLPTQAPSKNCKPEVLHTKSSFAKSLILMNPIFLILLPVVTSRIVTSGQIIGIKVV